MTMYRKKTGTEMEQGEQGFMLVGLIVAIFFILLVLSVAAPKVAEGLRRDREVEAVHRGNQYVRAIRLFYRKTGHYPGSIEQLEKTNNIRFLRQRYLDPMTGKDDWRMIKVGEAKTTVKGFFGAPLAGLTPGLGSAAGMVSPGTGTSAGGTGQQSSGSAFGSSSPGAGGFGSSSPGTGGLGSSGAPTLGGSSGTATGGTATGAGGTATGTDNSGTGATNTLGSASGIASNSGGSSIGGGAPFVGVGVPKEGDSITVLNEQTTYNTWEFIYDPRIEQLYAKGALFGGGASGLGSAAGNSSGIGGAAPSSGFGTTPSSGFGSTPGSGFGSTPGTSSPTTTPPQQPQ